MDWFDKVLRVFSMCFGLKIENEFSKEKSGTLFFQSLWRALDNTLFIFFKINWGENMSSTSLTIKK
jgi:hypothetical protein